MMLVYLLGVLSCLCLLAACAGFKGQKAGNENQEEIIFLGRAVGAPMPELGVCNIFQAREATTCHECQTAFEDK